MSEELELGNILAYETVQIWLDGLRQHWGGDPVTDDSERLPTLEAFCQFARVAPDDIIKQKI